MQLAATVNSSAEDGGLAQVFTLTGVNSLIAAKLTAEGVTTLMEFTNMWTKAGYETEATEYRNEVESLKDVRVEGSRLRAAIVLARAVLDRPPINAEDKAINDWECPLDAAAKESISKSWKARYGVVLTMYLDPADPLVNRLYREFRQNSPSLIPVAKIRSVYVDHNPSPEKKVHLPGGMSITVAGQEQKEVVRDVAHYYYALRILANASAKAGNYLVPSKAEKDANVVFAPLDVNLDYADLAFRNTLKQSGSPYATMKWLEDNDLQTRGLMINFMRGGYPQGEALLKAIKETEIKWASPGPALVRRERSRSPRRSKAGSRDRRGAFESNYDELDTAQRKRDRARGGRRAPSSSGSEAGHRRRRSPSPSVFRGASSSTGKSTHERLMAWSEEYPGRLAARLLQRMEDRVGRDSEAAMWDKEAAPASARSYTTSACS